MSISCQALSYILVQTDNQLEYSNFNPKEKQLNYIYLPF